MTATISKYTTRLVTQERDIDQCEEIWSLAFGKNWSRGQGYAELTRVLGAFEGDALHAVVGIIDYEMNFNRRVVKCGGIAAVATAPGQRYQSLITLLMQEAIKDMHEKGFAFSSLYPFSFPFYGKMGYAGTQWQYRMETQIAWLKTLERRGNPKRFRLVLPDDAPREVVRRHNEWAKKYNLSLIRTEGKFNSMLTWKGSSFKCFVHDDGYMLFHLDQSTGNTLVVPEFAYGCEQTFLDGLSLLAQMDSQFEKVVWLDADPEPFLELGIPYPRPVIRREVGMMTRVVNIAEFEKALGSSLSGISIADPFEVSGGKQGDVGPGELVQIVTGFWKKPPTGKLAALHGVAADSIPFTVERY